MSNILSGHKPHTKKDADYCLWYFRKHIYSNAELIGSFKKGEDVSGHDIDILLKDYFRNSPFEWMAKIKFSEKLKSLLDAEKVTKTDWGGMYFHNTVFGNVDVFFTDKNFDY